MGKARSTQKLTNGSNSAKDGAVTEDSEPARGSTKLRRMPHVFCKLLDLPFAADTHVVMEERRECYAYVVQQPGLREEDVVAEVVQIVPGAIKVMLRGADRIREAAELAKKPKGEMVNWRARLPACTIPEAAEAMYMQGIITITIPKLPSTSSSFPVPSATRYEA